MEFENRSGPRYLANLDIKAEWDEPTGTHIISEGTTENIGPEGTLVHLPRQLPDVGSTVRLEILGGDGERLQVIAEVLRIERNPGHPLAALQLVGETNEWKGLVWEPAAPRVTPPAPPEDGAIDDDDDDEDDLAH
ncbi:MAG TPA: PilZ domain-containing protein [Pyrinomonadaceae bacterium]